MSPRVLILTTESLPPWPVPTAGGGVRVWGLGEALYEAGCRVAFLVPKALVHRPEVASWVRPDGWDPLEVIPFASHDLDRLLSEHKADLLVVEQWQPLMLLQSRPPLPTVVDLPGPLLLESIWREPNALPQHFADKIRCLSMADGVFTALPEQRGYAVPWAVAAGLDLREDRLRTVPFSLPAMPAPRQGSRGEPASFLSAGIFWPWHDIESGLRVILDRLSSVGSGRVVLVGGKHPHHSRHGESKGESFGEDILGHSQLAFLGLLSFSELIEELRRSTVAVDLSAKTVEREFALAIRTGVALWAGCPVMIRPWSLWAPVVEHYNAGWIIDDIHAKSFGKLIEEMARERVDIVAKRRGARDLVEAVMLPQECIRPLLDWAKNPPSRKPSPSLLDSRFQKVDEERLALQRELDAVAHTLDSTEHDLDAIRGHPLYKFYKSIQSIWAKK